MRNLKPLVALGLAGFLAFPGCGADDEDSGAVADDAEVGDSLPPGDGKTDGYTVPQSLGLDKHGIIYLTFDDGPSPLYTARILDVLARHHAKATFFITGANIAGNEPLLRRERDEGHFVGNHQWKHVVATQSEFRTWVTNERDTLARVVGTMPAYFRYPFGAMASWKETILKELGYPTGGIGWDLDSLDWDFGPDARASRPEVPATFKTDFEGFVLDQVRRRGGGVILFHDVQSITASHLDSILTKLEAKGFRFGTLPANPGGAPVSRAGFIGDACATEADCHFDGAICLADAEHPGGYCTMPCTTSCPDRTGYATTRCVRAPDGLGASMDLCAIACTTATDCRQGYQCEALHSPAGVARSACW